MDTTMHSKLLQLVALCLVLSRELRLVNEFPLRVAKFFILFA